MEDFEKLGVFYLGKEYDIAKRSSREELMLYDSKDLVTHAVCVGMTGSGKTGLCVGLLEEAAIDGIPAIIIDPKGDLSNLLLTFPELKSEDFIPWVNEDDARKKSLSIENYAGKQAEMWKNGLEAWGQDKERIKRLKNAVDFTIFTPGSNAGIPVSILSSFSTPEESILIDSDLLQERINTTVTSLLNLLGEDADPLQSREHILLSTILDYFWKEGRNLDLAGLIYAIQKPPVSKIGVFDLESFFPSKDRFELAMKLNNLLAAPGFSSWIEGEPLDINRFYYTKDGKPRISIFSISHLNDAERMFFVSLLLTQLLGWMRSQSGTTSLRALFYMDEVFGYLPPVANPPSKGPLMTLLKQARAFGLGIVLSTQNPMDLDYKGLSNTGTWFIGRLQTDRDKDRVLDGLEGASAGAKLDRKEMEKIITGLGKRVFLMNNVHEDNPVAFETRWVMSYLRGPLTRNQIKKLMEQKKENLISSVSEDSVSAGSTTPKSTDLKTERPVLPPDIPQYFIPTQNVIDESSSLLYVPMLYCAGKIYFNHSKYDVNFEKHYECLVPFSDPPILIDWDNSHAVQIPEGKLKNGPDVKQAIYGEFASEASSKKNYLIWSKDFNQRLYREQSIELFKSSNFDIVSNPEESERDFRIRLQQLAREKRDEDIENLREKYDRKILQIEEKIRKAEHKLEIEQEQAKQQKLQTAISFGTTLLGAFMGRKRISRSTVSKATTAARGASRAMKELKDVDRAEENLDILKQQLSEIQEEMSREIESVKTSIDPLSEELQKVSIRPKAKDIAVSIVAFSWVPYFKDNRGGLKAAW